MMYCICDGCGKKEPAVTNGQNWFKPDLWYERTPEGERTPLQACSRNCIQLIEAARKDKGLQSTTVVLPL